MIQVGFWQMVAAVATFCSILAGALGWLVRITVRAEFSTIEERIEQRVEHRLDRTLAPRIERIERIIERLEEEFLVRRKPAC